MNPKIKNMYLGAIVLSFFALIVGVFGAVPIAHAFTIDGPTNFVGPGGGIVRFDNPLVSTQMNTVNLIHRFANSRNGGQLIGSLGFDCDTGDNMTLTGITLTQLTYTITGAGEQRIYFQGYGRPTDITGGTVVVGAGDTLVVTTTGAGTVTLVWSTSPEFRSLIDEVTGFLVIAGLIPMVAGAVLALNGNLSREAMIAVVALTVSIMFMYLIWGTLIKPF